MDNVINLRRRIAHLEKREAALKASNTGYRRLLETLPDAVMVHSGGKVAFVNRAAQLLCGADSHQQLIGRLFRSLFVDDDDGRDGRSAPVAVSEGGGNVLLNRLRRLDRSEVEVEISSSHIIWNDKPARITILRDVTQRRRAIKAMQASIRAKNEFLANMSHELRTPLNAIIGFSEIMQQELLGPLGDPRYNAYAGAVYHSGKRLLDLTTRLLELSRIESGTMPFRTDAVEIAPCVANAVAAGETGLPQDVEFHAEIADDLPRLMADERLLTMAVGQMVRSVHEFAGPGVPIALTASVTDDGGVAFRVRHEDAPGNGAGAGVPLAEAWEETTGLAGLGLSLTAGITSLFGGVLSIDRPGERGIEVVVRFPPERTAG